MKKKFRRLVLFNICLILIFNFFFIDLSNLDNSKGKLYVNHQSSINISESAKIDLDNKTWGLDKEETFNDVVHDHEGNFFVAGYTASYGSGSDDIVILKYNSTGNKIWNRTWGSIYLERPEAITVDSNNDIYIVGYKKIPSSHIYDHQEMIILKYNSSGNLKWAKQDHFGSEAGERALSVVVNDKDEIFISGFQYIDTSDGREIIVLKYNKTGHKQWMSSWGLGSSYLLHGNDLTLDEDDNIYVIGYKYGFGTGNMILVKFNYQGEYQWTKTWNWGSKDWGKSIIYNKNSNHLYCAGYTKDLGMFLIKYDLAGNKINEVKDFGGLCDDSSYIGSQKLNDTLQLRIDFDAKGNLYVPTFSGTYESGANDLKVYKFDPFLNLISEKHWGGDKDDYGYAANINHDNNQTIIIGKTYSYGNGTSDGLILYNSTDYEIINPPSIEFQLSNDYINSTNPLETHISIEINCTVSNDTNLDYVYLCENSTKLFMNRSMNLYNNGEWFFILDISGLNVGNELTFSFYAEDSFGNIGKNDNLGKNFSLSISENTGDAQPPGIKFEKTSEYLNSTDIKTSHKAIDINCNVSDDSSLTWVYLCENSTGIFKNRTMFQKADGKWYFSVNLRKITSESLLNFSFYANDSFGNIGKNDNLGKNFSLSITENADSSDGGDNNNQTDTTLNEPEIIINKPIDNQKCNGTAPFYDITVNGAELKTMWYSFNTSTLNITISETTGQINQELWNNTQEGNILITFYVKDVNSSIGSARVIVNKELSEDKEDSNTEMEIPGYNQLMIIILLTAVSLVAVQTINRKKIT